MSTHSKKARIGKANGMYGKKITETHRNRLSEAHKGKHHSEETRKKMSEGVLKAYKSGKNSGFKKNNKPWNYIDGRSKGECWERYGPEWRNIRKATMIRDNFTCQFCGSSGLLLHVHHKIPFMLTKNNDLDNLITLCAGCHKKEEIRLMKELKKQGENFVSP